MSVGGFIVMWHVVAAPLDDLRDAWCQAGYVPVHFPMPLPEQALVAAINDFVTAHPDYFARRFPRVADKIAETWFINATQPQRNESLTLPWTLLIRSVVNSYVPYVDFCTNGNIIYAFRHEAAIRDDEELLQRVVSEITTGFKRQINTMSANALSLLLTETAATEAHGVKLRNGVFFIPLEYIDEWRKITKCLDNVIASHFYEIPILSSERGDDAVGAAVVRQLEEEMLKIGVDIDHESHRGELKRKTLLAGDLDAQLSYYEKLFSGNEVIANCLSRFRAQLATALIVAESMEEK